MPSKKAFLVLGLIVVAGILFFSVLNAQSYVKEIDRYIEVCANGLTYVPSNTAYVKCYGVIRKVVGITEFITATEEECKCPDCCDGFCYIIIVSEPTSESDESGSKSTFVGPREIKFLWMPC